MQTNNPANLPSISVSLYTSTCLSAFFEGGSPCFFLWVASNFHGSFPSLQVSVPWKKWLKHVKTCWGSKSQILHEERSDWQFLQSPNLARLIVHNSHMHLYALYFPYVCCWCSGFSVAILLDWRVVGFSHSLSPVKWMVLQQQQRWSRAVFKALSHFR